MNEVETLAAEGSKNKKRINFWGKNDFLIELLYCLNFQP